MWNLHVFSCASFSSHGSNVTALSRCSHCSVSCCWQDADLKTHRSPQTRVLDFESGIHTGCIYIRYVFASMSYLYLYIYVYTWYEATGEPGNKLKSSTGGQKVIFTDCRWNKYLQMLKITLPCKWLYQRQHKLMRLWALPDISARLCSCYPDYSVFRVETQRAADGQEWSFWSYSIKVARRFKGFHILEGAAWM